MGQFREKTSFKGTTKNQVQNCQIVKIRLSWENDTTTRFFVWLVYYDNLKSFTLKPFLPWTKYPWVKNVVMAQERIRPKMRAIFFKYLSNHFVSISNQDKPTKDYQISWTECRDLKKVFWGLTVHSCTAHGGRHHVTRSSYCIKLGHQHR